MYIVKQTWDENVQSYKFELGDIVLLSIVSPKTPHSCIEQVLIVIFGFH